MRREHRVTAEAWMRMWSEIEVRVSETQKKLTVFPPALLVEKWIRNGLFTPQVTLGGRSGEGGFFLLSVEVHCVCVYG